MHATELFRLVEWAVERRTSDGEMFTALDVSQDVQARGAPYRHRHLKEIVHALFEQGHMPDDYTRSLCDMGGRTGSAWVYHRESDDPSWYGRRRDFDRLLGDS